MNTCFAQCECRPKASQAVKRISVGPVFQKWRPDRRHFHRTSNWRVELVWVELKALDIAISRARRGALHWRPARGVSPQIWSGRWTSALMRIPEPSRTSREAGKVAARRTSPFFDHPMGWPRGTAVSPEFWPPHHHRSETERQDRKQLDAAAGRLSPNRHARGCTQGVREGRSVLVVENLPCEDGGLSGNIDDRLGRPRRKTMDRGRLPASERLFVSSLSHARASWPCLPIATRRPFPELALECSLAEPRRRQMLRRRSR